MNKDSLILLAAKRISWTLSFWQ